MQKGRYITYDSTSLIQIMNTHYLEARSRYIIDDLTIRLQLFPQKNSDLEKKEGK